jgi:hypothetical protein
MPMHTKYILYDIPGATIEDQAFNPKVLKTRCMAVIILGPWPHFSVYLVR